MAYPASRRQLRAADRYLRKSGVSRDLRRLMRKPESTEVTTLVTHRFDRVSRALVLAPDELLGILEFQYDAALSWISEGLEYDFTTLWYFAYKFSPADRERLAVKLEKAAADIRDIEARDDRWRTGRVRLEVEGEGGYISASSP